MGIKIYKYKFQGKENPVVIEANNRDEARAFLDTILEYIPEYAKCAIVDEKIESPVSGVTEKKVDNIDYVWYSLGDRQGWLLKSEYQKIFNNGV